MAILCYQYIIVVESERYLCNEVLNNTRHKSAAELDASGRRGQLSGCDQTRDGLVAALTTFRKVVRELSQRRQSPYANNSNEKVTSCRFCGLTDASTLHYVAAPGSSFFVKLPLHSAHLQIEKGNTLMCNYYLH